MEVQIEENKVKQYLNKDTRIIYVKLNDYAHMPEDYNLIVMVGVKEWEEAQKRYESEDADQEER